MVSCLTPENYTHQEFMSWAITHTTVKFQSTLVAEIQFNQNDGEISHFLWERVEAMRIASIDCVDSKRYVGAISNLDALMRCQRSFRVATAMGSVARRTLTARF